MSGPEKLKPIEIPPAEESPRGEWIGFAVLFLLVAAVFTLLLLWLTGSFLIALATSIGMIALMLGMGYLASGKLDQTRRR